MNGNRIIVHVLIKHNDEYLIIRRSKDEDPYPDCWDIPGGMVEYGELPRDAVKRETKEEVNLNVIPTKIIHEDSNLDKVKNMVLIRLVYLCELNDTIENIKLNIEHSEYKLIKNIDKLDNVVPFLKEIFEKDLK